MIEAREFIREKRERKAHAPERIRAFIEAYLADQIEDYQVSAWLMAAFLNGLDEAETDALTGALIHSGRVFDWSDLGRPSADKHSTGGVGDKISLILAPLVAACGVLVPMVSGRGLGHTGGTLDKLESIPGFKTSMSPDQMKAQLDRLGVVMVGQGPDLAPADGRLYALRDVTSTVEFEPFIVSSIVSKKVAEGAGAIVYDVKCGNGAFMKTIVEARSLATRLVRTTQALGRQASALITDMDQPLGLAVGNSLEVRESVEVLKGGGPADVRELTLALSAEMLVGAGAAASLDDARGTLEEALDGGEAWTRFVALAEAQGGDASALERENGFVKAPKIVEAKAERAGVVGAIDAFALGDLVVDMGGGRRAKEDDVDPRVGLVMHARVGDRVAQGDVLAEVHAAEHAEEATRRVRAAIMIGDVAVKAPDLVRERVG